MIEYRPRYPESPFRVVCDFVEPSSGKTYREINEAKPHNIPIGTLVEILAFDDDDLHESPFAGVRLFVVHHHRDCDGTPLYAMAFDKTDTVQDDPRFHNGKWLHGFPEDSLLVVEQML